MLKIMLIYKPNGWSRLGRILKSLLDGGETGLLWPNSWRMVVAVVVGMMISSTISDCTETLPGLSDNSMFHVYTCIRGHHLVNLTVTAKLLCKMLTNISAYKFPVCHYTCWMQLVFGCSQIFVFVILHKTYNWVISRGNVNILGGHCDESLYEQVYNHEWLTR
jgi:hypothetical protein